MEHVIQCEGIDFTDRINSGDSEVVFTQSEIEILKRISTTNRTTNGNE